MARPRGTISSRGLTPYVPGVSGAEPHASYGPSSAVVVVVVSYTFVFNRLTHHTHRTQLQRTFCEGLHGAPPAEPNTAFYTELDERLRLQHSTLAAVHGHGRALEESLAAQGQGPAGRGGPPDTVALRRAVNSSLVDQMAFLTSAMAQYCLDGTAGRMGACTCPGCDCTCASARRALEAQAARLH
ncbi:hypothetical protein HYH03_009373 [Edaphochlamys debaryana]|uniref:Uncharacterized protein n=1 Tax=Edaphochlamys debaryana TaxID=47281 RepID=A0A836BXD8_9CHLO|nr:hypothetical protein HYH03_009373 [Edaphochlamys debaryana]|eukprot:KAG2492430.1 hypothetical protein HYH03_009373 [Edaphochlamys debaryana]